MELEQKCLRMGSVMIVFAILLRLLSGGVLGAVVQQPQVLSLLLLMETGRWVRPMEENSGQKEPIQATQPSQPTQPGPDIPPIPPDTEDPVKVVFGREDGALIQVHNASGCDVDVQTLLQMPLSWDLTQGGPAVLIVHSHSSESYTKTEDYQETDPYRTLDIQYNMISVGERIAQVLEAGGVQVLHDKSLHDYPSYNNAYNESRTSIAAYLDKYPSIRMVLDIHRDAVERADGTQIGYTVDMDGQKSAQLMMVVGTDAGGLTHPNWRENMALALKLYVQMEKIVPGICRPISFRNQRFNQDMSAGAMLIEVGAAGNTRQEALLAAEQLALGILSLAYGAEGEIY